LQDVFDNLIVRVDWILKREKAACQQLNLGCTPRTAGHEHEVEVVKAGHNRVRSHGEQDINKRTGHSNIVGRRKWERDGVNAQER